MTALAPQATFAARLAGTAPPEPLAAAMEQLARRHGLTAISLAYNCDSDKCATFFAVYLHRDPGLIGIGHKDTVAEAVDAALTDLNRKASLIDNTIAEAAL